MAVDDKIKNELFVWGNSTSSSSDLSVLTIGTNGIVDGEQGGNLIYADRLNSALRGGSLVSYTLIEALKKGPNSDLAGGILDYNNNWYDELPDNTTFSYMTVNSQIGDFATNLNTVINQYLKYSSVFKSVQANKWSNSRTFKIASSDGTNLGEGIDIDGSSTNLVSNAYVLKLPATIKANLEGNATSATTAAFATNAGNATNTSFTNNEYQVFYLNEVPTPPQGIYHIYFLVGGTSPMLNFGVVYIYYTTSGYGTGMQAYTEDINGNKYHLRVFSGNEIRIYQGSTQLNTGTLYLKRLL